MCHLFVFNFVNITFNNYFFQLLRPGQDSLRVPANAYHNYKGIKRKRFSWPPGGREKYEQVLNLTKANPLAKFSGGNFFLLAPF